MKLRVKEPPEKKTKTKNSSPPEKKRRKTKLFTPPPPSFSLLPDEIMVNCLARIPISYYPRLSIVSKSFMSLLSSTDIYTERSRIGNTEKCLYVCLRDFDQQFPQWFTLWINPNRTMQEESSVTKKKTKKKKYKEQTRQLLVPIPSSKFPSTSKSIVVVGSEIYVIGGPVNKKPSSIVQILDCRSHTWRDAPSMNVARFNAASCFHDGKIYVIGGRKILKDDEPWAEVLDIKTQTWERFSDPGTEIRKSRDIRIAEKEGKIYVGSVSNMYVYDTKKGKWELCDNENASFLWSKCVIENVPYFCSRNSISFEDGKDRCMVEGLDSLREKHSIGWFNTSKLVSFGGKLLLLWEEYRKQINTIRYAEIVVEKRDGGEVWGNVEWVDVVHMGPSSWKLLHQVAVSV